MHRSGSVARAIDRHRRQCTPTLQLCPTLSYSHPCAGTVVRELCSEAVFDRALKVMHRNAAARASWAGEYDYLQDEIASRLVDRLNDITHDFPVALDLGSGNGAILRQLQHGEGGIETLYMSEAADGALLRDAKQFEGSEVEVVPYVGDEEWLPFPPASLDAVMSNMALHWVNDIPHCLKQVRECLRPDGVFIAACLGGETLIELRTSFVRAELERTGAVTRRMSPLMQVSDAANLMQSAGFAIPTVDTDLITVEYPSAAHVMEHLSRMGESGAPLGDQVSGSLDALLATCAAYQSEYGQEDGSVTATFQVVYMIGWAPSASQRQPLSRGSAEFNLMEELGGGQPVPLD